MNITKWCLALSGVTVLSSLISAQEYLPNKLHPIETVCKATVANEISMVSGGPFQFHGFIPVAETYYFGCAGGGKNAWKLKVPESGDIMCSAFLFRNVMQGIEAQPSQNNIYNVVSTHFVEACPQYINGKKLLTNALTIALKKPSNPHKIAYGYMLIGRGVNNENYYKLTDHSHEFMCATGVAQLGYRQKGVNFYDKRCDPHNENAIHGQHWVIPSDYETGLYQSGIATSRINLNFIDVALYPLASGGQLQDIKRAKDSYEQACVDGRIYLPLGYLPIGRTSSTACIGNHNLYGQPNTHLLKRIGDKQESTCKRLNHYMNTNIPHRYTIVGETNLAGCYWDANNPAPNAYQLRYLEDIDTVCKTATIPDDYGIVGETHVASCKNTGNNAWQIKILDTEDVICRANYNVNSFPKGYVIAKHTFVASCPAGPNNAWHIRPPHAPTDSICADLSYPPSGYIRVGLLYRQPEQCSGYTMDIKLN